MSLLVSETAAVCWQKTTAGAVTAAPAVNAVHAAHVGHAPHAADAAATTTLNRVGRDATLPAPPILPLQQGATMSNNGRAGVLLYELLAISQWVCLCQHAPRVSESLSLGGFSLCSFCTCPTLRIPVAFLQTREQAQSAPS
jgi:hypothetical protein